MRPWRRCWSGEARCWTWVSEFSLLGRRFRGRCRGGQPPKRVTVPESHHVLVAGGNRQEGKECFMVLSKWWFSNKHLVGDVSREIEHERRGMERLTEVGCYACTTGTGTGIWPIERKWLEVSFPLGSTFSFPGYSFSGACRCLASSLSHTYASLVCFPLLDVTQV